MSEIITFQRDAMAPARERVFENQGIPAGTTVQAETEALYTAAIGLLSSVGAPAGIILEVSQAEFERVYHGQGWNEPRTPVGDIYPQADSLALFAVTVGERISREIKERFAADDFALACMLDSAASVAADDLAERAKTHFLESLAKQGRTTPETGALTYSPGYCGWHITGQERLFEALQPEQIGITLSETFLMQPMKSVSGVVLAGPRKIHDFRNNYPFCSMCETQGCRARIRGLLAE
jgi:hypothetical protein